MNQKITGIDSNAIVIFDERDYGRATIPGSEALAQDIVNLTRGYPQQIPVNRKKKTFLGVFSKTLKLAKRAIKISILAFRTTSPGRTAVAFVGVSMLIIPAVLISNNLKFEQIGGKQTLNNLTEMDLQWQEIFLLEDDLIINQL